MGMEEQPSRHGAPRGGGGTSAGGRLEAAMQTKGRFMLIVPIFLVLLLVSAVVAPSSVGSDQIQSLLFFSAILGFAALGQHLVVTVGGLDLSVAPVITLSGLLFASHATSGSFSSVVAGVAVAVVVGAAVGLLNGVTVTFLRVTPLIATLGGGAVATGLAYTFNGQGAPSEIPQSISDFLAKTPLGIPVIAYAWIAAVILVAAALRYTPVGRRFTAVGANPRTARALGVHVDGYKALAYVGGGVMYSVAGIFVAVAVTTPGLKIGDPYLLQSISAVVIGGTALGGGLGSVGATAVGTLFVVQLNNFTLAVNGDLAVQQIVQGAVIVLAMAIYGVRLDVRRLFRRNAKAPAEWVGPAAT
jgi:ribose transport system permease protein